VNLWDQRYAHAGYFYGRDPNDFLREHVTKIPREGSVLCLGEGEGRNAVFLAGLGYDVEALDQSSVGLGKARMLAEANSVHIRTAVTNLDGYRFEGDRWDGIVSIWCHLPAAMRGPLHRQIFAGLKPGGIFLLEAYTPDQLRHGTGGPKDRDLLPSLAEVSRDLAGMEIVIGVERERVVQEGAGHSGLSAVVQIAARRPVLCR